MAIDLLRIGPRRDPEAGPRIQEWVREVFTLATDVPVSVMELRCLEEGCPPLETALAVLDRPGQPRTFKIHKPMSEVTHDDVARLLTSQNPSSCTDSASCNSTRHSS